MRPSRLAPAGAARARPATTTRSPSKLRTVRIRSLILGASFVALVAHCGTADAPPKSPFPSAEVRLVRDDSGITHVYAETDADAFYGMGYTMARDRLFQMELTRRQALGRSAELFGASSVKADTGARAFDFAHLGEQDDARTRKERPGDARLVDAWIAGVNARIAEITRGTLARPYGFGAAELDFVPEPWQPSHAFAVGKLLAFGLSNSLDAEILATAILNLAPDFAKKVPFVQPAYDVFPMVDGLKGAIHVPPPPPPLVTPVERLPANAFREASAWPDRPLGSNNWAVAASKTDSGKPYVCGDPHQALTNPTRLWPVHLSSVERGGTLDVVGFAFVGTPAVELGQNARVAWSATTNFADVMDLWDVTTDGDRTKVTLGDGEHAIVKRTVAIKVRGGEDQPVDLFDVPGYGVLLPDAILPVPRAFLVKGNAILFQWVGFRPTRELSAFVGMDRAANVQEFQAAVDLMDVGAENFVAADATDILYHVHGAVPDRGTPGTHPMPWHILDGMDKDTLWTRGDLGPDRLPHVLDPKPGFIGTANTDPWGHTADGNVENDPFYYGTIFSNGFRLFSIDDRLSALVQKGQPITRTDLEAMQRDVRSPLADTFLPELDSAVKALGTDVSLAAYASRADLTALAAKLVAWDHRMLRDRGEPLAFTAFVWFASKRVFETLVTKTLFSAIGDKSPPFWPGLLRNVTEGRFVGAGDLMPGGRNLLFFQALDDAAQYLKTRFGTSDPAGYRWEQQMAAQFPNTFGGRLTVPPTPIHGGLDTLSVSNAPFFHGDDVRELAAPGDAPLYRMVMGFDSGGAVRTTFDLARGTSEDPDSAYFSNLQGRWADAEHAPLFFARADVEAHAKDVVVLPAAR